MSLTISGVLLAFLSWVTQYFALPLLPGDLDGAVKTFLALLGLALAYIGRIRQGDVTWYGKRL